MTLLSAFDFTLAKILELQEKGISLKIEKMKLNENLIKKYNSNKHIPFDNWISVIFLIKTNANVLEINKMANYLALCGIRFDTGGMNNNRYWELDWSFEYKQGSEHWEWISARESVEEIISKMNDNNLITFNNN